MKKKKIDRFFLLVSSFMTTFFINVHHVFAAKEEEGTIETDFLNLGNEMIAEIKWILLIGFAIGAIIIYKVQKNK